MYRLVEASAVIREAVPDELAPVFWLITALGSAKILMIGLSLAYWNGERYREELLSVISVAFLAVSVTLALKYGFDLPRPPEAVRRYPIEPSPVGFPSGHAIASTTIYGGIVLAFDRYRDAKTVLGVGVLVSLISLSRVVLGVHYLGDILAGFAVGLVMLGVVAVAVERGPTVIFALAVLLSIPAVVVTTETADAALAVGGSVGGLAATVWRTGSAEFRSRVERLVVNGLGLGVIGLSILLVELVETVLLAAVVVNLGLAFSVVAMPALIGRFDGLARTSTAG